MTKPTAQELTDDKIKSDVEREQVREEVMQELGYLVEQGVLEPNEALKMDLEQAIDYLDKVEAKAQMAHSQGGTNAS